MWLLPFRKLHRKGHPSHLRRPAPELRRMEAHWVCGHKRIWLLVLLTIPGQQTALLEASERQRMLWIAAVVCQKSATPHTLGRPFEDVALGQQLVSSEALDALLNGCSFALLPVLPRNVDILCGTNEATCLAHWSWSNILVA